MNKEMLELALMEISSDTIGAETLTQYQVLCLPENFGKGEDNLIDAEDSLNLSKHFKLSMIKCATSYDLQLNSNILERRSYDIWFGQIFIIDSVILPTIIDIIAHYIAVRFRIGENKEINKPQPQVNIEIKYLKNGRLDSLKFKGDGETLIKILENINPQNEQEK